MILFSNYNPPQVIFNISDMITEEYETYDSLKLLEEEFKIKNSLFVTYHNPSGISLKELCELDFFLQETSLNSNGIQQILSTTRLRRAVKTNGKIGFKLVFPLDKCNQEDSAFISFPESPWMDILYSKNSKDISFEIQIDNIISENQKEIFDFQFVENFKQQVEDLKKENKLPGSFLLGGSGFYQYFMQAAMDFQNQLNFFVLLAIIIFFRILYGTFRSSLLFMLALLPGYLFVIGLFSLQNYPIDVLSNSLFIIFMISCSEDFFYLIHLWDEKNTKFENFKKILLPSFFTSLTTFIGFLSLSFSEIDTISRYGLLTALSAIIEWIMMFSFLPAVITIFPNLVTKKKKIIQTKSPQLLNMNIGRFTSLALLGSYFLCFITIDKIKPNDAIENLFKSDHILTKYLNYMQDNRDWKVEVSMLFPKDLPKDQKIIIIEKIKKLSQVKHIEDYHLIEQYYLKQINIENDGEVSYIKNALNLSEIPSRLIGKEYFRTSLYLDIIETQDIQKFSETIKTICEENCFLADDILSYSEFSNKVSSTLVSSLIMSLFLVASLIFYLSFRRFDFIQSIYIVLSSLWGPVTTCFLLWLIDIDLNQSTCIFAGVLVGLAGDNAIQFIFQSNSLEISIKRCFYASINVVIFTFLLTIPFYFGEFKSMRELGMIFFVGVFLSAFGDIWILRGLSTNRFVQIAKKN